MSLVLELSSELETALAAEAAELGLPLSEYALRLLAAGRVPNPHAADRRAEIGFLLAGARALVGTRQDIVDAPGHARALRQQAEKRERS